LHCLHPPAQRHDWGLLAVSAFAMTISISVPYAAGSNPTATGTVSLANCVVDTSIVVGTIWSRNAGTISLTSVNIQNESDATLLSQNGPTLPGNAMTCLGYLSRVTVPGTKVIRFNWSAATNGLAAFFAMALAGTDINNFYEPSSDSYASGHSNLPSVNVPTQTNHCAIVAIQTNNNSEASPMAGYSTIVLDNVVWNIEGEYNLDTSSPGVKAVSMQPLGVGDWVFAAAAFRPLNPDNTQLSMGGSAITPGIGSTGSVINIQL
jgi:hypothetical protein